MIADLAMRVPPEINVMSVTAEMSRTVVVTPGAVTHETGETIEMRVPFRAVTHGATRAVTRGATRAVTRGATRAVTRGATRAVTRGATRAVTHGAAGAAAASKEGLNHRRLL